MKAARQHAASGNYLFFDVGEYRFCAPVDDVEAIVELSGVHRLPVAPKGVAGTVLFRGQLAVVCDLGAMLGVAADAARKDLSVVVRLPIGLIAFRVDHVSDIVAAGEVKPQKADERAMKEWMDGYVMQGPHIAFLTTFDKLLRLFGVTSVARLSAVAEEAQPPQSDRRPAGVAADGAGGRALQPVAARKGTNSGEADRSVAHTTVEAGAPQVAPEVVVPENEPFSLKEAASVPEAASLAAESRESPVERHQPLGQPSAAAMSAGIEVDAASGQTDVTLPAESDRASEFVADEPQPFALELEPIASSAEEAVVVSVPEIAEPQDHVAPVQQAVEEEKLHFQSSADASTFETQIEPAADAGKAPYAVDIDADLSTRYASDLQVEVAPELVPEDEDSRKLPSDASQGPVWEVPHGSPEETPLAEVQASRSQKMEVGAGGNAQSAEVAGNGERSGAPFEGIDDSATRDAESWTQSDDATSTGTSADMEVGNRRDAAVTKEYETVRSSSIWMNDSIARSAEPELVGEVAAERRGSSASTVSRPNSGRRSRTVLTIVSVVVLAVIVIGWWWLVSPETVQKAEVRRAPEVAAPQPVATGPIEKRSEPLEIVGKDFELRVEPASPSKAASTQAPAAPASRDEFVHVVVRGDTLWNIAAKHLGDPYRYPELARNSAIRNPDLIHPGDVVRIRKRR